VSDDGRYSGQFRPEFSRLHLDRDLLWVVPFRVRYMLGITGARFAGKSTALAHLAERHGFRQYTLSMTLREIAAAEGAAISPRSSLQDLGDRLRKEFDDPGYLARLTLRRIRADFLAHQATSRPATRIVVGGFKRPEEVRVFASIPEFRLLAIDVTDDKERIGRGVESGVVQRELVEARLEDTGDPVADFEPIDRRDREGTEGDADFGQAVDRVLSEVDDADRVANSGDKRELFAALDEQVRRADRRYRLPRGH
jgi:hypothetical protein